MHLHTTPDIRIIQATKGNFCLCLIKNHDMQKHWPKSFVILCPVTLSSGRLRASHLYCYGDSGLADGTKRIPFPSLPTFKRGQLASFARFFIYDMWLLPSEEQVSGNLSTRWRWVQTASSDVFISKEGARSTQQIWGWFGLRSGVNVVIKRKNVVLAWNPTKITR